MFYSPTPYILASWTMHVQSVEHTQINYSPCTAWITYRRFGPVYYKKNVPVTLCWKMRHVLIKNRRSLFLLAIIKGYLLGREFEYFPLILNLSWNAHNNFFLHSIRSELYWVPAKIIHYMTLQCRNALCWDHRSAQQFSKKKLDIFYQSLLCMHGALQSWQSFYAFPIQELPDWQMEW